MHNQIHNGLSRDLCETFKLLNSGDFRVYITSDHGNIEAKGMVVPTKGQPRIARERVRIFRSWFKSQKQKVISRFLGMATHWPSG